MTVTKSAAPTRLPDPPDEYSVEQQRRLTQLVEADIKTLWTYASSWLRYRDTISNLELDGVTDDTTFVVPAGFVLKSVYILNTTSNAVTGGIKIGTTDGGTEVVSSIAVGADEFAIFHDGGLFSTESDTTLYLQDVTSWNSASLNIRIQMEQLY